MADGHDAPRNLEWYEARWKELMDLLPASSPGDVVDKVRELHVGVLDEEAEALDEMGLTNTEEAKQVLRSTFERLQKLRRENQGLQRLLDKVGADSPEEVAGLIDDLRERIRDLEKQQDVLSEAGFERPEHAVRALASMEEQLAELYGEKEATEHSLPRGDVELEGDTFEQLQVLMAREERLQRELGVSSPDAVVEMVEGLTDQLEDLYSDRDGTSTENPDGPATRVSSTVSTLEEELGVSDPDALVQVMHDLAEKLDDRKRAKRGHRTGAEEVIEVIRSARSQLEDLDADNGLWTPDGAPRSDPLLQNSSLASLEEQSTDALNQLPVGVFCVDDHGTIRRANENVLRWPDVEAADAAELVGSNFFEDVAPATANPLFLGRFEDGVAAGEMDEQFVYTYVGLQDAPTNLSVRLHRKPDHTVNWIIFRVL